MQEASITVRVVSSLICSQTMSQPPTITTQDSNTIQPAWQTKACSDSGSEMFTVLQEQGSSSTARWTVWQQHLGIQEVPQGWSFHTIRSTASCALDLTPGLSAPCGLEPVSDLFAETFTLVRAAVRTATDEVSGGGTLALSSIFPSFASGRKVARK